MSLFFDEIFSMDNLEKAYKRTLTEGGKFRNEALIFQRNETVNLVRLQKLMYSGKYKFSGYEHFEVFEPKRRVINAPMYKDKIVQAALSIKLNELYNPKFIFDSYSCIEGKGTHKAVAKVQKNMRSAHDKWGGDAYIVKVDVSKFFYSIDRSIAKQLYRKVIKEADVLAVVDEIVDSADEIDEIGLPLGNSISQLCANIYLNELDQYCTRYLHYKHYVRYADDIVIIRPNKVEAQKAKAECVRFLGEKLNLVANPKKSQIFPITQGINAFGFKIYSTHKLLRNDSKKKIKRKVKKMPRLVANDLMTVEKANQILGSWSGHAMYADSHRFIQSILDRRSYIRLDGNIMKINEEELKKCYTEMNKVSN